ncbi:hypothetical protein TrispH2_001094 [Trichoplax sp. H2]|nr:hypothetical protein TrispH2_001094 [Trichoplax sp. H2]|eukprot:RDD46823.1 hypothetical protein TrispH2_001094 [Trichoplax sp. H2]
MANPLSWLWSWCLAFYGAFLFAKSGMLIKWHYPKQLRKGSKYLKTLEPTDGSPGFIHSLSKQTFINFTKDGCLPCIGRLKPNHLAPLGQLYSIQGEMLNLKEIFQQFQTDTFVLNFGSYS